MARAPLLYELESEFNRRAAEETGHQDLSEYYKSLLTGAQKTAATTAQTQYTTEAQTAAERASYDISGAYANYLKQQRNIAAQGRLESGYKEEVGDVLQQQYQTAYSQAKATQASALTSAKKTAQDLYSDIFGELSKSAKTQIESIEKQSKIKANLANAMIEQSQLSGDTDYEWFTVDKEGKTVLSDWGYDQMSKYLMTDADTFTKYLQDKGLKDELEYYLSAPTNVRKELFGIAETGYDPLSEESLRRRLSTTTTNEKGEIVSYIDTLKKPSVKFKYTDFGTFDTGAGHNKFINMNTEVVKYATESLGLTDAEIRAALDIDLPKDTLENAVKGKLALIAHDIKSKPNEERFPEKEFDKVIQLLINKAKEKYIKTKE
jgi:hypothetical protein